VERQQVVPLEADEALKGFLIVSREESAAPAALASARQRDRAISTAEHASSRRVSAVLSPARDGSRLHARNGPTSQNPAALAIAVPPKRVKKEPARESLSLTAMRSPHARALPARDFAGQ
jgi:hypothetical protein